MKNLGACSCMCEFIRKRRSRSYFAHDPKFFIGDCQLLTVFE